MKKITALLWVFVLPMLAVAQSGSHKISQELSQRMNAHPAEYHEVLITLADQVDTRALLYKYEAEKTPLAQRSFEVITQLQEKAAATQPAILARLDQTAGVEKGSATSVWIVNLIYVRANADAIERIASWNETGEMILNYGLENEPGSNPQPSVSTPNSSEPGLRAIKAPFMWAKGYTGYGRKGLVIDTGQDGDHPALLANFWGNHVPKAQAWNGSAWPEDCADHGSHVAGIMFGLDRKTNDTIGVAYNANWLGAPMFFPVNTDGTGCSQEFSQTIFTNLQSFQWALNPDGNAATTADQPDCINNSWRAGNVDCGTTSAINSINALEAAGVAVIFAQGNAGPNPSTVTSGAAINTDLVNTFAVGAVNGNNASFPIADFSSRGPSPCGGSGALQIKPEVSAPGVSVRSSFNNGIYSAIDGTSMAAPHAAGALILLKEAFPALSGIQLKTALYNSAIDLGTAGEDNVYGKGMINLEAAFNLLVSQGNTPATPVSFERDAILGDLKILGLCKGPVEYTVGFENGGTTPITSIDFSYGIENGTPQTYTWTGNLTTNTFVNFKLPAITGVNPGTYTAIVTITSVNGQSDTRPLNNQIKLPFTMANEDYASAVTNSLQTTPVCSGSRVLLTYDTDLASNEVPQWYASATGGTVLSEGASFLTPPLSQNSTYYVTSVANYNAGKENATGTSSNTKGGALQFDVYKALKIKTVKVVADETGARIIELVNNLDAVVASKTVNLTQTGEQRITLNFNVPVGEDYVLRLTNGKELKQTGSAGYPHTETGVLSIFRGITPSGINTNLTYYYFYDWEIEVGLVCGRTAVPVAVSPSPTAPTVNFETNPTTVVANTPVTFSNLTASATAQFWDFGNQQTSSEAQPSVTYTAAGDYKVYLVSTTANGCTNAIEKTITVQPTSDAPEISDFEHKATLFPNPTDGTFAIRFGATYAPLGGDVQVFDMLGRAVLTQRNAVQQATVQVDASTLANGVYFVQVTENGELRWMGRFVKK